MEKSQKVNQKFLNKKTMEMTTFYTFIYILIILIILRLLYNKRIFSIVSPIDLYILFFTAVIIINCLYIYYPKEQRFDMYNLDTLNHKNFNKQVNVFLRMMTLFLIGVFIYILKNKNYIQISSKLIQIVNVQNLSIDYITIKKIMIIVLYLCCSLVIFDYGSELFYRFNYIPQKSSMLKTIYTILLIILSVLSAISLKHNRITAIITIVIVLLIGIGLGSRMATVDLIVFVITYSFMLKSKRIKIKYFIIWIPLIIVFFGYNIALRTETNVHGLIPYLNIFLKKPEVIYKNTLFNIYYTFVYGFVATSETIKLYHGNIGNLITCINPMPGNLTNWYSFSQRMRINIYAPYTSIGELAKFPIFSFIYYIFLGYYFSYCDFYIKKSIQAKKLLVPAIIIILLLLFIMFSFEYNLRSSIRYLYYSAFILMLSKIKINGKV